MRAWLWIRLPWVAALLFVMGSLVFLLTDKHLHAEVFPDNSIHKSSNTGLSIAHEYLKRHLSRQASVAALTEPLDGASLPADSVVVRIQPQQAPVRELESRQEFGEASSEHSDVVRPLLYPGEERWIREGGRLVLGLTGDYGPLQVRAVNPSSPLKKVWPIWPGVTQLETHQARAFGGIDRLDMRAVFTKADMPVVAIKQFGKGELIILTCPEIFQNEHLNASDHLAMLENIVSGRNHIFFDEFVHNLGRDGGIMNVLRRFGFGALLLAGAVAYAFYVWRIRVRLGPPEDSYRETRNVTLDLVESLSPLYQEALHRHQALTAYYKALLQSVATQSGLRGDALKQRVNELTLNLPPPVHTSRRDIDNTEFLRQLKILNDAFRRLEHGKRG